MDLGHGAFFFSYRDRQAAESDFSSFCSTARAARYAGDLPCNFFLCLAEWVPKRLYPYVIAMLLREEYEHQVSEWLSSHNIRFGDDVEFSLDVKDFFDNARGLQPSVSIDVDLGEGGFFFSYRDRQAAESDYSSFCTMARAAGDLPCNFFLCLAEWVPERLYPYVIAMVLPEEYEHHVSEWLSRHNIGFGEDVEFSLNVTDFYDNARRLQPSTNFFRSKQ
jgi:hypothetical protein